MIDPADVGPGRSAVRGRAAAGGRVPGRRASCPGRALLDAGAIVVLATDANPGTAPVVSMPIVLGLAARLYGFSVRETLAASTLNAAWTLGLEHELGSIEVGKRADLVLLDGPAEMVAYRFGHNPVAMAMIAGELVYMRDEAAAKRVSRR